jgi:general secretion pathway protein G
MEKAFTMIELIFVIVILGILAAVAIPKMMATRDDAKISVLANRIKNSANEISTYVFSQMKVDDNLSKMSNIMQSLEAESIASIDTSDKKATLKIGSVDNCLVMQIKSGDGEYNLTLTANDPGDDIECKGVQGLINFKNYPIVIKGQLVKY